MSTRVSRGVELLRGRVASLSARERARLFDRGRASDGTVQDAVRAIIAEVRARGDAALRELAWRFDGARLAALEVPRNECERALAVLDPAVRAALQQAAANIGAFHRAQLPGPFELEVSPGVRLGRRAEALRRVGVYAPGGRAAYPSSVLMGVVPAKVAGVGEVVVCSPPGEDGLPPATVLAACALAGADRVFALGGAGAIAALALGTESVPRVDRIVGPGNAYVTEAKQQLTGQVAIDSPAGPSEVLIIADESADPELIAIELLAQAEHDPDAAAVLVATSEALCAAVADALARLLPAQPRTAIIRSSLAARGALLVVEDLAEAVAFAERYAPEHLLVLTADPRALLPRLRAAGTTFLGAPSSVAFGDYLTGANHVLPTAGLARAYAGLSTADFLRWSTYQEVSPRAAARLASPTAVLAEAEGLPAHALAARLRGGNVSAETPVGAADDVAAAVARGDVSAETRSASEEAVAGGPVARAAYRAIAPYDPGRLPCDVDLTDNTNLFGPSPAAGETLRALPDAVVTRYPSVYATELKRALARLHGVEPEHITTGCGSDDVIDSALRAFCEPGARVAYPDPTFGMVPVFGRMNALEPVAVPLGPEFELDADALLATGAAATYLCRPNNPTGTAFARAAVMRVSREARGLVLLDEAYADFADDNLLQTSLATGRTVVLRTLSKAYGLAGLRVGYAIGPAPLIAEIEKSRGPYKVNGAAEAAALAVLARDLEWVRERVAEVRANRERLLRALEARGARVWPSAANFLLLSVPGTAARWNQELRQRGVAVRPFAQLRHAGESLRVSVGPWPMLERFLDAYEQTRKVMAGA